ncbi:RDD family protein [Streptomyces cupreus]|uniref:RDD family protein n=1 Tax=Streptomyces cupreus TaxID=2759956 RepID=A0A7X1JC88_9ACTN|nr:RDD family protein [Streptomyces cupreus]MBC2907609.1 RDD family protein [Streptomyces cupreus]
MSAPTPAPGDDRPREGYYPDPSIPGYVRYWNGAAWVPGTSRPAPTDGEPLAPPPGVTPAASVPAPVEETGPHFFDEDPVDEPAPDRSQHGSRPEPAAAWGADRSRQSGFGGDQDRRVSWGTPDPRTPAPAPADGMTQSTDGTATIPPAEGAASGNTFVFRRPTPGPAAQGTPDSGAPAADEGTMTFRALSPRTGRQDGASGAQQGRTPGSAPGQGASGVGGTGVTAGEPVPGNGPAFGTQSGAAGSSGAPGLGTQSGGGTAAAGSAGSAGAAAFGTQSGAAGSSGAPGLGAQSGGGTAAAAPAGSAGAPGFGAQSGGGTGVAGSAGSGGAAGFGAPANSAPQGPGFGAGKAAAAQAQQAQVAAPTARSGPHAAPAVPQQSGPQAAPQVPAQGGAQAATPVTTGPGGGQPSWAQQVHRLAGAPGEDQPAAPWKPPVEDVFQAAARRQASARPASLGKRLTARLLDTVVLAAVTGVAAVPLGTKAIDHIGEKIDAAKLSGETVTVWLLDGTTAVYLGIVLAVLLLFGALYEALPTAKWGRTLGKKLLGLEVRDIEAHEPPSFGGALRRWLVYSVPGLLVIGVVGILWCLFDKPWRQCWHDKAAGTFVAG